ncbi:MAG: hypothetical protein RIS75_289 [Actinomycetota bacterium]|jgi:MFS family permease
MRSVASFLGVDSIIPQQRDERLIAIGTLINTFGNGLFYTVSAIYFTRIVGLSAQEVGFGLSCAAVIGLVAAVGFGRISDLREPRKLSALMTFINALLMFGYAFAQNFISFLILACAIAFVDRGGMTVRATIISRIGGTDGRVRIRAYLRAVTNLGIGAGSLIAGFALVIDQPWIYRLLIVINGVSTLIAAYAVMQLQPFPPFAQAKHERASTAIRDFRFVGLTALNGILSIHYHVLELAVPLWVISHTSAPVWVVAVALFLNTVACVLFQVRLSKGTEDPHVAGLASRNGSWYLAASLLIYASASIPDSPVLATVIILIGAAVHVTGELRQAAGAFGIGYGLPPEHMQGQYQGVWSLGMSGAALIAPIVMTTLVLGGGMYGWSGLALVFLIAGFFVPRLVDSFLRQRARV